MLDANSFLKMHGREPLIKKKGNNRTVGSNNLQSSAADKNKAKIMDNLKGKGFSSVKEMSEAVGFSYSTVRKYLELGFECGTVARTEKIGRNSKPHYYHKLKV